MNTYKSLLLTTIFIAGTSVAVATDTENMEPRKVGAHKYNLKPTTQARRDMLNKKKAKHLQKFGGPNHQKEEKALSPERAENKGFFKFIGVLGKKPKPAPKRVLPTQVDLSSYCTIFDQGELGSCTGNAIAGCFYARQAIEFQDLDKKVHTLPQIKAKLAPVSRLFIYYKEREMEGTVNEDAGASIGDGMYVQYKYGAPKESQWPYDISKFTVAPPESVVAAAKENRDLDGVSHDEIDTSKATVINAMRHSLANKQPLVLGILLYSSFESDAVAKTGHVPMPNTRREELLGGHAVLAVGYDDKQKRFKIANSWGTGWGNNGFFTLPYDYFKPNYRLASECWQMGTVTTPKIVLQLAGHHNGSAPELNNNNNV